MLDADAEAVTWQRPIMVKGSKDRLILPPMEMEECNIKVDETTNKGQIVSNGWCFIVCLHYKFTEENTIQYKYKYNTINSLYCNEYLTTLSHRVTLHNITTTPYILL